jgi:DMSO/TMAO reductase YedYZ molybdopterin-dependent catalytic subunit
MAPSLCTLPAPPQIASPLRDVRVTARVGRALGIAVTICFVTGLISHLHQHPVGLLPLPPSPAWGYRVTQGLHVATGIAAVPLVVVKLFSVYPKLLEWPPVRSLTHALERLSVAVLVGAMLFELVTGLLNVAQWYPWGFFFPAAHWAVAWALVGAILLHLAVKLPVIVEALHRKPSEPDAVSVHVPDGGLTRRGLLTTTAVAVGAVTLVTVGQTLPGLGPLALLAPRRPDDGPQGVPVNRTSLAAAVRDAALHPGWQLAVGSAAPLTLQALQAMPQHEVDLPIACVEGWSASVLWGGVRLRDVLEQAGIDPTHGVRLESLERQGLYRSTVLTRAQATHPDTLLALRARDDALHLEHGYPLRLIAPNRPGVLQTKWLARIEPA